MHGYRQTNTRSDLWLQELQAPVTTQRKRTKF